MLRLTVETMFWSWGTMAVSMEWGVGGTAGVALSMEVGAPPPMECGAGEGGAGETGQGAYTWPPELPAPEGVMDGSCLMLLPDITAGDCK